MSDSHVFRGFVLVLLGAILGGVVVLLWQQSVAHAQTQQQGPPTMQDVARLKEITPPSSHPMVDVAMFAANIWFAGEKGNWRLSSYYLGEIRNRIRWEVRLNPGPMGADGKPVPMADIFDGIDHGSLTRLKAAIDSRDAKQFGVEYRQLLEDCYSCHKTANKAFLRPQIPVSGAQPIINLDPAATWPQ